MAEKPALIHKLFEKGKVFTASNLMSLLRFVGAFYLYHVTMQHQVQWALWVTIILIITDFADGYLARRLNQVSELGKVLDPLADKACAALSFLALYWEYGLPFWVVAVVIGRDVLILLGSVFLITRLPYVTPSAMPGKIAVTLLSALYLIYLLNIEPLKQPVEWLAIAMLIISSLHYAFVFYQKIRKENSGDA
jgi:CDP-diacylglycerol--glycerol-3-phosphate 3-phosphatidyltransferase